MGFLISTVILMLGLTTLARAFEPWSAGKNYGKTFEDDFGNDAANWGHRDQHNRGYGHGWRDADAAHAIQKGGSKAYDRGDNGWTNGNRGQKHFDADGHAHHADESAARAAEDEEGGKRYSYFTQGNGPDGFYSKGYFGSNGYEHEAAKAAEAQAAAENGYKKGSHNAGKMDAHGREGHDASRDAHHFDDIGREHAGGAEARGVGEDEHYEDGWKSANENNGWRNGYAHGSSHHPHSA